MSVKLETGCGGPYPAVLRCPQTKQDTFFCSVCIPGTQWQGHTTRRCPRLCVLSGTVLLRLVCACHKLDEHRQEETATFSGASIRTGADRRTGLVRQEAGCEWGGAEEDTTKVSAGALSLACQFVDWPWIMCAESTHAGKVEDDPSSAWEAQLVADERQHLVLLLEGNWPLDEQWLQELMREKLSNIRSLCLIVICHKCSWQTGWHSSDFA